jgi:hypothetical protein
MDGLLDKAVEVFGVHLISFSRFAARP